VDEIPQDPYKFDEDSRKRFMELLAETGRIFHACKSVGISTTYIYQRRKIDDQLSSDMDEALGVYKDTLEAEMYRRAVEGVVENKYHQGLPILDYELNEAGSPVLDDEGRPKIVGQAHVRRYSDTLLLAHARRHIPEYNEKKTTDLNVRGLDGLLAEISDKSGDLPSVDEKLDDE
jgi:hypothetical protein